ERDDLLRLSVFEDREVGAGETFDWMAILVEDGDVQPDQVHGGAKRRRWLLSGELLVPGSQQAQRDRGRCSGASHDSPSERLTSCAGPPIVRAFHSTNEIRVAYAENLTMIGARDVDNS